MILAILTMFLTPLLRPEPGAVDGRLTLGGRPAADAAVWLTGGSRRAEPVKDAAIDQRGKAFSPHVLVVPRGSVVAFPNSDALLHNVYAQFEAKRFDLGLYPKGQIKRQQFDRAGIVSMRCNIHSQMSAYIVVVETPYYAVTDRRGRFHLPAVPPGTYRLHVWHESGARDERTIAVGDDPAPLEIALPQR